MAEQLIYESKKSKIYLVDENEWGRPVIMKILNYEFPTPFEIAQFNNEYEIINGLQLKDNNLYGKMDKAIVEKFSDLQLWKKNLLNLQEKADKISTLEADLNTTRSQLIQAQSDLDAYRRQATGR